MKQDELIIRKNQFLEDVHFYINENGYVVLTEKYHLEKGFCCGRGCLHCPYNYENISEYRRRDLITARSKKEKS